MNSKNNFQLSKRIQNLESSGIRKVFDLAQNLEDPINLSIGQAHFPVVKELKTAMQKAVENDANTYTPTLGSKSLRQKITKKLQDKNQIPASLDEVMITSGVSGGIFLALGSLLDPGDEVILPDPYFVSYQQILSFLGVKTVLLDTYPNFRTDSEKLQSLITKKTKMIILNSPSNPTGQIINEAEMSSIVKVAKENDSWLLSDEIYEAFDFNNKFVSPGSRYEKTITLNGFSKSHFVPGWRVAYAHAPKIIIEAMSRLQQYSFVCAPSCAQIAISECFDLDLSKQYEKYAQKSEFVYNELKDFYEMRKPEGAFYAFLKKPEKINNFDDLLIKNKVLTVPGQAFSQKSSHFRLSFAVSKKELSKGIKILKELA